MSYTTNTDIQTRLGSALYIQLTDDSGTGSADSAKADDARIAAESEIDSYLATRFRVPLDLSTEPDVQSAIKSAVIDLAIYRLHCRKPPVPADVTRRRIEAIDWLQRIADGDIQLPATLPPADNTALGTLASTSSGARQFTRDTLRDI